MPAKQFVLYMNSITQHILLQMFLIDLLKDVKLISRHLTQDWKDQDKPQPPYIRGAENNMDEKLTTFEEG
jgi:hypothetical protein